MPCLRCAWRAAIAALFEEAEAHRLVGLGVMAGRPRRDKGVVVLACDHRVGRRHRAADAAHHRFPGARRHRGVAVEIDDAARCRRDVAQLVDIMPVVTERDQVERAFGRRFAHQTLELAVAKTSSTARMRSGRSGCPGGVRWSRLARWVSRSGHAGGLVMRAVFQIRAFSTACARSANLIVCRAFRKSRDPPGQFIRTMRPRRPGATGLLAWKYA